MWKSVRNKKSDIRQRKHGPHVRKPLHVHISISSFSFLFHAEVSLYAAFNQLTKVLLTKYL